MDRVGRSWRPRRVWIVLAVLLAAPATVAAPAAAAIITAHNDAARTGWYPDQPRLSRQQVTGGTFGQLFAANVVGQVYAQPLVSNGVLLVATEDNRVYGLDPETGVQRWTRNLGNAFQSADVACGDLAPSVGITRRPSSTIRHRYRVPRREALPHGHERRRDVRDARDRHADRRRARRAGRSSWRARRRTTPTTRSRRAPSISARACC